MCPSNKSGPQSVKRSIRYTAVDKTSEHVVDVKEILTEKTNSILPKAAQREICVLLRLEHNNIINMIEICQTKRSQLDKPTFYLVLAEIKMIMIQLLNGPLFLHTENILHRDVTPENFLITKSGTV